MKKAIHIRTLGLSRSEENSLAIILPRKLKREIYWNNPKEDPELIIVNLDHPTGIARYEASHQRYPKVPGIGLSTEGTGYQDLPIFQRPIRSEKLIETIERLLSAAPSESTAPSEAREPRSARAEQPNRVPISKGEGATSTRGQLVRDLRRVAQKARAEHKNILFLPNGNVHPLLFSRDGSVYTSSSPAILRSFCTLRIKAPFPSRILQDREAKALIQDMACWDPANLLWEIAYGCAHAHPDLPEGLTPSDPVQLRHWPNCTVLRYPTAHLLLSALLYHQPRSIEAITAAVSHLPEAEVRCFVGAAYSLGYLEKVEETVSSQPSLPRHSKSPRALGMMRSLVSKLASCFT